MGLPVVPQAGCLQPVTLLPLPKLGQGVVGTTRVQLPARLLSSKEVVLTALSGNSGSIVVGNQGVMNTIDGTGNGYILEAGKSLVIYVENLNQLFVIGTAAGQVYSWAIS